MLKIERALPKALWIRWSFVLAFHFRKRTFPHTFTRHTVQGLCDVLSFL